MALLVNLQGASIFGQKITFVLPQVIKVFEVRASTISLHDPFNYKNDSTSDGNWIQFYKTGDNELKIARCWMKESGMKNGKEYIFSIDSKIEKINAYKSDTLIYTITVHENGRMKDSVSYRNRHLVFIQSWYNCKLPRKSAI